MPFGERKRKVVEEDKYVSDLEFIIKRDFFPHSEAIELNLKYYDALEKQDLTSLKEVQTKLNLINASFKKSSQLKTDAEFESGECIQNTSYRNPSIKEERDLPLDEYLARNTSEDNDSFRDLQQSAIDRQLLKFESSVKQAREHYRSIETDKSQLLAIKGPAITASDLETFKDVRIFNQVFFSPDSAPLSASELINLSGKKSKMNYDVFKLPLSSSKPRSSSNISDSNVPPKNKHTGKIGPDGKEIMSMIIPDPCTPDNTPDLTWGEIDGTPHLLRESPVMSKFYIPQPSHSDTLAAKLINQISEKKRAANKKEEKSRFSIRSKSKGGSSRSSSRLTAAGMKLLSRMTPSFRSNVHRSGINSRLNTPSVRLGATPSSTVSSNKNITDGLLEKLNT